MKQKALILVILISLTSFAQNKNLTLKEYGDSLDNLIPIGWKKLDSKTGDLNNDGILDLVFAIQNTDKKNIKKNDGLGTETIDLNPRILGIYFGTKSGLYEKKLISNEFIILRDSPTMDEPFEGFSISKKGVLEINFQFWYSAGSWYMSNHTYKFRFQENEFTLIGYDANESNRSSGKTVDYSINFLTKKMKITKGNFSKDKPDSINWINFDLKKMLTLETMNKPFELEFEGIQI